MYFVDILNLAFSVQCDDCFASSFSPITAAWATQGYWMQATIIEYLGGSGLSTVAALIYAIAVGAGIVGYTLGSPPRNYLWYFIGPALFHFLLFTTEPTVGVAWQMGVNGSGAPIFGNQTEVWKLAEVGLVNQENVLRRGVQVTRAGEPSQQAEVSTVFLTIDGLFSDFIQGLVGLLGTKEMMANRAAGDDTNIPDVDNFEDFAAADFYRISNSKWGMLENITYASVKDIKMLKSLAVFFGSDCGDTLVKQIDQAKFTAATRARSGQLPESIFKTTAGGTQDYKQLKEVMAAQGTHISPALKQMFPVTTCGGNVNSLTCFSELTQSASTYLNNDENEYISCDNYLAYMIEGMRWESGNAYYQLINSAPEMMAPKYVLFNLFYGWGIRRLTNGVPTGRPLNAHDELIKYTPNLILVHILRNMFEFTSVIPDQKFTPADDMINLTQYQQRNISSKTKFVEVYSWALMIPYIQGLVLYFLSIAYPVVCIAMIMPNLYKLPLTWIKFWFWAKSWDLGFAIVMAIDKSVWAMMSNSPKSQTVLGYIGELSDAKYHPITIDVNCANKIASSPAGRGCADAVITDSAGIGADPFTEYLMPIFDKAMILSKNLELDLANSYYIYIMAALYFAVPAVTGQLVGSIGGLAGGALDKFSDVKSAANAGVQSDKNQRLNAYSQLMGQEKGFSTQRNPGGGADFGGKVLSDSQMKGGANGAGAPLQRNAAGSTAGTGVGGGTAGSAGSNRVAGTSGIAGSGGGGLSNFGSALAAGVTNGALGGKAPVAGLNRGGLQTTAANPNGIAIGQQDAQAQQAIAGANAGQAIGAAMMPGGAIPGRVLGAALGALTGAGVSGGMQASGQSVNGVSSAQGTVVSGAQGAMPNRVAGSTPQLQANALSQAGSTSTLPASTMKPPGSSAQGQGQRSAQAVTASLSNGSTSVVAGMQSGTSQASDTGVSSMQASKGTASSLVSSTNGSQSIGSRVATSPTASSIGSASQSINSATGSQAVSARVATQSYAGSSAAVSAQGMSISPTASANTTQGQNHSSLSSNGSSSSVQSLASSGGTANRSGTSFSTTTSFSPASLNSSSQPSYAQNSPQSSGTGFSNSDTGSGYTSSSFGQPGSASTTNVASSAPSGSTRLVGGGSSRGAAGNTSATQIRPQSNSNLAVNTARTAPIKSISNVS